MANILPRADCARPAKGKIMPVPGNTTASQSKAGTTSPQPSQAAQQTLPVVVPPPAGATLPAAKPKRRWWIWGIGGLVAAGLAGLLYLQPWATPIAAVTVETVVPGPVMRVLAVNGRIAGLLSLEVRPLVSGTLVEVLVTEGDTAPLSGVLMRLDTAAQQAVVRQALAGLDAAWVAQEEAAATLSRTQALGANAARVVLDNAARAAQTAAQEVARMTALLEPLAIAFISLIVGFVALSLVLALSSVYEGVV